MKITARRFGSACALAALATITSSTHAGQTWDFTLIANNSTTVPGSSGTFTFFDAPTLSAGTVAFAGYAGPNQTSPGIYTGTAGGPIALIANTSTATPGTFSTFSGFERPAIDGGGEVAFVATSKDGTAGVYAQEGGTLSAIADTHTATPGFNGNFSAFGVSSGSASIDKGTVAFAAFSLGGGGADQGIYTSTHGTLSLVADRSTALAFGSGTENFIFISRPTINNGNVIFQAIGSGSDAGVYELKGGSLTRIIDSTMTLPGTTSLYAPEGTIGRGPVVLGDRTAFFADPTKLSDSGFYGTDPSGKLIAYVTDHTTLPGYTVPLAEVDYLSLGATGFTFWGASSQIPGALFFESYDGSVLERILGTGDTLDGKTVASIFSSDYSYSGGQLAVQVEFSDGTFGLFLGSPAAAVPEPSSVITLAIGATGSWIVARLRRRPSNE
jgi:hypothetical protein